MISELDFLNNIMVVYQLNSIEISKKSGDENTVYIKEVGNTERIRVPGYE